MRGAWYDSLHKWDNFLIHIWEPYAGLFSQRTVVFLLPLPQNKNSIFQNNLNCPFASSSFRWNSHFLHLSYHITCVIKKSLTTKTANTIEMSFEPIFSCRFNFAAWHLLTKPQSDPLWAVTVLYRWWVFSPVLLSSVCVFWGHISLYCCKLI